MADTAAEQIAALTDKDWAVREEAAALLGTLKDTRAVVPLVAVLKDPDRSVREAAVGALTALGEAAVQPLAECLSDGNLTVQELAASILAVIADARVEAPVTAALDSQDWIVRMHAATALGRLRSSGPVPALIGLLQDKVKAVREEAAHALVYIGAPAVPPLIEALKHEDWLVRLHAVEALGKIKSPDAVQPLLYVLFNDHDSAVREDAARALGETGDPRAVEFLLIAMREVGTRPKAVEALGLIKDRRAVPALIAVVDGTNKPEASRPIHGCSDDRYDEELFAVEAAVTALGRIGDPGAIPVLVEALRSTMVRKEAAEALGSFGRAAIAPLLELVKGERDENLVHYAKEALTRAGWRPTRI